MRLIFVQLQESLPSEGRLVGKSRLDGARQLTKLREIVAGINGKRIKPFMLLTLIVSQLGCTTSPEFQEKEAVDKAISQTAESARNYLADTTLGDWNRLHGTQIEYLAANGRAYLWYPGNRKPVSGEWETRNARLGAAEICFRYGTNTYNPVTRTSGGSWECQGVYQYTAWKFERVVGDPFHLESGRLPFVLPASEHVNLTAAVERAGYSQNVLKWKQGGYSLRDQ